jgi:hypothetical protein
MDKTTIRPIRWSRGVMHNVTILPPQLYVLPLWCEYVMLLLIVLLGGWIVWVVFSTIFM